MGTLLWPLCTIDLFSPDGDLDVVRCLDIKEMPLQEKYDRLLESYVLGWIRDTVLHKELGAVDKCTDLTVRMQKKMIPSTLGPASRMLKTIAPGRTFKQLTEQYVYTMQGMTPLSNIELSWVSDREAVVNVKNCPVLQKIKELVKKTGANVDPKEPCETESQINKEIVKEFGIDLAWEHTENGCRCTAKLK